MPRVLASDNRKAVILDSNMLYTQSYDYKNFINELKIYLDFAKDVEKSDYSDIKISIFLPELVLEELYEQQLSNYNEKYEILKEQYDKIFIYEENKELLENNYDKYLSMLKERIKEIINIIPIVYSKTDYKKLVGKALKKNAPFDKTYYGKKSDSGFKDAVIWENIVNYDWGNYDELYFISCDLVFRDNKEILINEFQERHKNKKINILYFEENNCRRQESINQIVNLCSLPALEGLKLYNINFVKELMNNLNFKFENAIVNEMEPEIKINGNVAIKEIPEYEFSIIEVDMVDENVLFEIKINGCTNRFNIENSQVNEKLVIDFDITLNISYENNDYNIKTSCFNVNKVCRQLSLSEEIEKIYSIFSESNIQKIISNTEQWEIIQKAIETINTFKIMENVNKVSLVAEELKQLNLDKLSNIKINGDNESIRKECDNNE